MNPIEILRDRFVREFPSISTEIDTPAHPDGYWHLDLKIDGKITPIEWRPAQGFGVCNCGDPSEHGYGVGPDEIFKDPDSTFDRVVELLGLKNQ